MSKLFKRMTSFRGRWAAARQRADRIAIAIAEDQIIAWSLRPRSRQRNRTLCDWGDILRSMVPA